MRGDRDSATRPLTLLRKMTCVLSPEFDRQAFADRGAYHPISVDPEIQNRGVGRALMQATVDHFTAQNVAGIRLHHAAYHNRSLCLYTSIGFRTTNPVLRINGPPLGIPFPGVHSGCGRAAANGRNLRLQRGPGAKSRPRLRPWRQTAHDAVAADTACLCS